MVTDKLRKYVSPNIPYVFIGWVFLKLGTAYRLAAGSDFAHKFIGLGQTVGAAFADFAPGLASFDWLIGKVFNSIDFSKSMHYNPLAYIKTEADILKFVNALISNTKGEGKEGDPFWTKAETLLYCALLGYIIFEGAEEDRNLNTPVDMISGMEVKEDDEDFLNAVDYMFKGLEQCKPNCFAVKQYKKYKLSSGVVCSKRLLNQAVGKSLRTHNLNRRKERKL